MIKVIDKNILASIQLLEDISASRREIEKQEQMIKKELRFLMDEMNTNVFIAGEFAVLLTNRVRKDLDKEKVEVLLGKDAFQECMTFTPYQIIEVKRA